MQSDCLQKKKSLRFILDFANVLFNYDVFDI